MKVLILGGTGDAAALATQIASLPDMEVITSLAGRTRQPSIPTGQSIGQVRIGGFGGEAGLAAYIQSEQIEALIDATHPFAAQISWNAAAASRIYRIPYLLVSRPAWQPVSGDRWIEVVSNVAAAAILPDLAQRVFLTIGRQELAAFAHLKTLWFLMRMIDPPDAEFIPPGKILLERGPFSLDAELALLKTHQIDTIVSKNSGGDATYAKIIAARRLGLPVVMVQRPPMPLAVDSVDSIEAALQWLKAL